MKRNMILIIGILILIGCKEQKEKLAKSLFDASNISNRTNYFYSYDSGRLSSQTEKTYTLMFGVVVDSVITQIDYEYNNKGLLIKKISKLDYEENPSLNIYNYDKNDSLISEILINQDNDTIFWEVYRYYPDGKKTISQRTLIMHFDPNQDFMEAIKNKKHDTLFYRNEFDYAGNLCITQRQFDIQGNLIKTVNFEYNGIHLAKETHLTYFNKMETTEKVKIYDYSKSNRIPDYVSVDTKNDTLEYLINIFDSDKLVKATSIFDYDLFHREEHYENDLLVRTINYNRQFSMEKSIYLFEYDEKGLLKTEKSYREKISAH